MDKKTRGGAGRGQGRTPVAEGQPTITVSLRMTKGQRDKLQRLGGAKWVRQRIDKAKFPNNGLNAQRQGQLFRSAQSASLSTQ